MNHLTIIPAALFVLIMITTAIAPPTIPLSLVTGFFLCGLSMYRRSRSIKRIQKGEPIAEQGTLEMRAGIAIIFAPPVCILVFLGGWRAVLDTQFF